MRQAFEVLCGFIHLPLSGDGLTRFTFHTRANVGPAGYCTNRITGTNRREGK